MFLSKRFGNSELQFYPLGFGTIWFGRQWPPDNSAYIPPDSTEIYSYLKLAYKQMSDQLLMLDTAPAYGLSEQRIGEFLQAYPEFRSKTFIATKWGENFDTKTGLSITDHSLENLKASLGQSLDHLGKIDLLYIHKSSEEVLTNQVVMAELLAMKKKNTAGIRFLGVSISDSKVLKNAHQKNLFEPFDVLQIPAPLVFEHRSMLEKLQVQGKAVVVNSPIRKASQSSPRKCFQELLQEKCVSLVLTGTRNHLSETLQYISDS